MASSDIDKDSNSNYRSTRSNTAVNSPINNQFPCDTYSPGLEYTLDAENDFDKQVPGWPKTAMLMATTPDFAAFSRFRDLNVKSLLYYQAELTELRQKLYRREWRDYREERNYAMRADNLMNPAEGDNQKQYELVTKMRKVLKEYNDALLQYSQVSALPEPDTYNMKNFRVWLRAENGEKHYIGGHGEEKTWGDVGNIEDAGPLKWQFLKLLWSLIWPKPPPSDDLDLVVTRQPRNIDGFTRWVATDYIPFYENFKEAWAAWKKNTDPDEEESTASPSNSTPPPQSTHKQGVSTLRNYSENAMLKFTSSVSTVVACLLPTLAIVVLSQIQGMTNLLLCLAGFVVIFSIGLIFLTSGTTTRVDIFTATAAFSAVLVVFISVPVVVVQ